MVIRIFALSISGRPHYKKWYGPLLYQQGEVIAAPYEYRSAVADYKGQGGAYYATAGKSDFEGVR